MIRTLQRTSAKELRQELTHEEMRAALLDPHSVLWLDIEFEPSDLVQVGMMLRDLFGFHPLALDDAFQESHVPRIDDWEKYLYVVLHALDLGKDGKLEPHEFDIFLGPNYLVTIHEKSLRPLDQLLNQCRNGRDQHTLHGSARLLYALADYIVSDYMTVVDGLDDEIDLLENEIFHARGRATISRIFRVRRTILKIRRNLGYLREVMNRLARDEHATIPAEDRYYFRDIYDHLVRMYDIVEGLRDMAVGALDSYLSVTSARINETMRTLTIVTVLFMPISFIASFMGMNFFGDKYAVGNPFSPVALFWLCITVMAVLPPSMFLWMVRRGWLRSAVRDAADEATNK